MRFKTVKVEGSNCGSPGSGHEHCQAQTNPAGSPCATPRTRPEADPSQRAHSAQKIPQNQRFCEGRKHLNFTTGDTSPAAPHTVQKEVHFSVRYGFQRRVIQGGAARTPWGRYRRVGSCFRRMNPPCLPVLSRRQGLMCGARNWQSHAITPRLARRPAPSSPLCPAYARASGFAAKMPLKLSRYWMKTRIHSKAATSAAPMVWGMKDRWNARML